MKFDKREIFEKVKCHLLAQNKKSACGNACKYISDDGSRCAIGCLLPDTPGVRFHNSLAVTEAVMRDLVETYIGASEPEDIRFLADLQRIHDMVDVEQWASALDEFEKDLTKDLERELA